MSVQVAMTCILQGFSVQCLVDLSATPTGRRQLSGHTDEWLGRLLSPKYDHNLSSNAGRTNPHSRLLGCLNKKRATRPHAAILSMTLNNNVVFGRDLKRELSIVNSVPICHIIPLQDRDTFRCCIRSRGRSEVFQHILPGVARIVPAYVELSVFPTGIDQSYNMLARLSFPQWIASMDGTSLQNPCVIAK